MFGACIHVVRGMVSKYAKISASVEKVKNKKYKMMASTFLKNLAGNTMGFLQDHSTGQNASARLKIPSNMMACW